MRALGDHRRSALDDIQSEPLQHKKRRATGQQTQVNRDSVKERGERYREEQKERGEYEQPREPPTIEGPGQGDAQTDESKLFEPQLQSSRPQYGQQHTGDAGEESPKGGSSRRPFQIFAFGPEDIERKRQHQPAVRHVLKLIPKQAFHPHEHRGKAIERAPNHDQERPQTIGL